MNRYDDTETAIENALQALNCKARDVLTRTLPPLESGDVVELAVDFRLYLKFEKNKSTIEVGTVTSDLPVARIARR